MRIEKCKPSSSKAEAVSVWLTYEQILSNEGIYRPTIGGVSDGRVVVLRDGHTTVAFYVGYGAIEPCAGVKSDRFLKTDEKLCLEFRSAL